MLPFSGAIVKGYRGVLDAQSSPKVEDLLIGLVDSEEVEAGLMPRRWRRWVNGPIRTWAAS